MPDVRALYDALRAAGAHLRSPAVVELEGTSPGGGAAFLAADPTGHVLEFR